MSGGSIFQAIINFFEEDDWNFHRIEGIPVLSVPFTGRNGRWMCYAQAREDQQQFVFYSVNPVNVPEERRAAIAEFITRANYGMIIGNFEMDYNDGEVRYKTSIDVEGDELTSPLIKQLVYANVIIMDRYFPGLMAVVYGNADPSQEIEKIEGPSKRAIEAKLDEDEDFPSAGLSEGVRNRIEDFLRSIERSIEDAPSEDDSSETDDDDANLGDEMDLTGDDDLTI